MKGSLFTTPLRDGPTLWTILHDRGLYLADRRALVYPAPSGKTVELSHAQLSREVMRVARRLAECGVRPGDHVGMVIPNSLEFVIPFLSLVSMRAVACPLNPGLKKSQLDFFLNDMDVKQILLPVGGAGEARESAKGLGIAVFDVTLEYERADFTPGRPCVELRGAPGPRLMQLTLDTDDYVPRPADTCLFLHTSGTTGRPKGVPLSHANLARSMHNIAETYALTPDDCVMIVMPLFHVHGLIGCLLSTLNSGGCSVVHPGRFSARQFWPTFLRHGCTWYSAVPTIQQTLLTCAKRDYTTSGNLRFIRSCSASLAPATFRQLEETFGVPVIEAYAMSEAAHQMTANFLPPGKRKPGAVGRGRGVELTIRSEKGEELPQGERGEVCVRGSNVMVGYYNNPEANRKNFFPEKWFRTGDQGYLDEDGFLFLTGRLKEMINRGGEKISPVAIDALLLEHPAVALAVTFGVPDSKYGEEVHAAIILKPGAGDAEALDQELRQFCLKHLPEFSIPKKFYFTDDVPRTATGKVQRRIVSAHFAGPKSKL
mmetsp:Transcript_8567/g.24172  ORF Transcript_8567/g.24172 Transcript_8567/m.24172 type:complete len:542 (+) Transcript_8567:105-1730(+)|eukprot:CAMPEP_0119155270 /NCGR_PEP_ID=MMETSP1310-20130426/51655_1 /TAXON_ID=464262 /ORGANISM="Genus nov. species nov., Strain RCC2339" /LENGTH=541 /DNA_ID=CAMNT_0007147861 /DNA_START=69 /DNA_END=1694 /DNA_ORIENTATION=-